MNTNNKIISKFNIYNYLIYVNNDILSKLCILCKQIIPSYLETCNKNLNILLKIHIISIHTYLLYALFLEKIHPN